MTQHVTKVASICFYHIRCLRQIRQRVGQEVTTRLVLALVTTRDVPDFGSGRSGILPFIGSPAPARIMAGFRPDVFEDVAT